MDRTQPELEILCCCLILNLKIMIDRIFLTFDLAFSQTLCIDQLHITMSGAVHNLIGNIKGLRRDQDRIAVHTKKSFDRITPCFIFQFRYIFTRHAGFFIDALFFQFFVDLPDQLRLFLHMRIIRFVAVTVFNDLALFTAFQLHFFELTVQISPASHNAVTFFTDFRSQCIDGFLFLRIGKIDCRQFAKRFKMRNLAFHFVQFFCHMQQTFPELLQLFPFTLPLLQLFLESSDLLSGIVDRFGNIQFPQCGFCFHIITVKCIDLRAQFFDCFDLCFYFNAVFADHFFCHAAFFFPGKHISIF